MDDEQFEEVVDAAIDDLPEDLRDAMSNVEVVVEDEPPPGQPLFGLYQGVPLTRRTSAYAALPDKISIYRGPLVRSYGEVTSVSFPPVLPTRIVGVPRTWSASAWVS